MKDNIKSVSNNRFKLSLDNSIGGTYVLTTEKQGNVTSIELEDLMLALLLFDDVLMQLEGH